MEDDVKQIAIDFAVKWLNAQGGDPLPEGYFTGVNVLYDEAKEPYYSDVDERMLVVEMTSDDDGGNAMMFLVLNGDDGPRFGAWGFDTTWGEMR